MGRYFISNLFICGSETFVWWG